MEQTSAKKMRDSNIELLRILAMCFIVIYHFAINTGILDGNNITLGMIFGILGGISGKIGVIIYVLIAGYFGIKKEFKFKKLFILWFQIFCYSIGLWLIFTVIPGKKDDWFGTLKNFLPVTFNHYWFVTVYIYLMMATPFINKFVANISRNFYRKMLQILTLVLVIIPTVFYADELMENLEIGTELIMFIYFYLIGGYIKLYGIRFFAGGRDKEEEAKLKKTKETGKASNNVENKEAEDVEFEGTPKLEKLKNKLYSNVHIKRRNILLIIACYVFLTLLVIIVKKSGGKISDDWNLIFGYFRDMYSAYIIIPSIAIFYLFKNWKMKYNKFVNYLASISLAVYLIHENNFVRPILWKQIINIEVIQNSLLIILSIFATIIVLYALAGIIEFLRINILEKNILKLKILNKFFKKADNYMKDLE